jgi:tripartite-type tricarboxylate transporter receptor subunit TctC
VIRIAACLLALPIASAFSQEKDVVDKIKIIVPFAAGGSPDRLARFVAESMREVAGVSVIIDNKAGGGSILGTVSALNAPIDEHTLLLQTTSFYFMHSSTPNPGYEVEDFATVAPIALTPYVLLAPSELPVSSFHAYVDYLKSNTRESLYGSIGSGSITMILAERMAEAANISWREIPYKAAGQMTQGLLTNQIQGIFGSSNFALELKGQPLARPLAITAAERLKVMPDIPTFSELGYPQLEEEGWYVLLTSAKTPQPVIEKMREIARKALGAPNVVRQIEESAATPYTGTIQEFDSRVKVTRDKFDVYIKKYLN